MAVTWFCPVCWYHSMQKFEVCPGCGHVLESYEYESYEEKQMRALSHPVREQRMLAIEALGRVRYLPAIPEFEKIVLEDEDPYLVREVMRALFKWGTPECLRILMLLEHHPSVIVRKELDDMGLSGTCEQAAGSVQVRARE